MTLYDDIMDDFDSSIDHLIVYTYITAYIIVEPFVYTAEVVTWVFTGWFDRAKSRYESKKLKQDIKGYNE